MRYYTLNRFNSQIYIFEYDPKVNPSQIVKTPTGRRQTLDKFKHNWFLERDYRQVCAINLGFFQMDDMTSLHNGLCARDGGFISGVPNNGYEAILHNNGRFEVKQCNLVGIKGIGTDWTWASSLSYSLILNGIKKLDATSGFSVIPKVERTAIGQKKDGTMVLLVADALSGSETADVMLELNCINALMGDGGGSSSMMVNSQWKKRTTRPLGTALVVFAKEDVKQTTPSPTQLSNPTSNPILKLGDVNSHVSKLQTMLKQLGYYNMEIDNSFGSGTRNAVLNFQRDYNLLVDGFVGNQTWGKLEELIKKSGSDSSNNIGERKIKIAIDAGHAMQTPGKGVPQMREHEFNAAVAQYAKQLAEHNGFDVLLTQPLFSNTDVPLVDRTNLAIKEKVDLLVSIHADANGNSNVKGHWAFYWNPDNITTSNIKQLALNSQKFAQVWDKYANQVMKNHCRGLVKSTSGQWNNFHMCRVPVTNRTYGFPSVLIEHGFMTSPDEIKLLLSDDFRRRCAETLVKSFCEYFGVTFKPLDVTPIEVPTTPPRQEELQVDNLYRVLVDGNQVYALRDKENIARNIVNELNNGANEIKIQKV